MRIFAALSAFAFIAAALHADEPPAARLASENTIAWEKKSFRCERPARGCYISRCCELSLEIFTRDEPGTDIREVRAVGEFDAPPAVVFSVLTDYAHFTEYMPYTVGGQLLWREGNEEVVWGMVDPPFVSRRDWVTRSQFIMNGPGGIYRTSWWPEESMGPAPQSGVVRLKKNTGSWTLEPISGGARTRATYFIATDPGLALPIFVMKAISGEGIPDLFEALRKRAATQLKTEQR